LLQLTHRVLGRPQVRADKQREVRDGHDGTWVAHPALVTVALEVFNQGMPAPNQIGKARDDVQVTPTLEANVWRHDMLRRRSQCRCVLSHSL